MPSLACFKKKREIKTGYQTTSSFISLLHTYTVCMHYFSATCFQSPGGEKSRPTADDIIPVRCHVPVRTGK